MLHLLRRVASAESLSLLLANAKVGDTIEILSMQTTPSFWDVFSEGIAFRAGNSICFNETSKAALKDNDGKWAVVDNSTDLWTSTGDQIFLNETPVYEGPFENWFIRYGFRQPFIKIGRDILHEGKHFYTLPEGSDYAPYAEGKLLVELDNEIFLVDPGNSAEHVLFEGKYDDWTTYSNGIILANDYTFFTPEGVQLLDARDKRRDGWGVHPRGIILEELGKFTLHVTN